MASNDDLDTNVILATINYISTGLSILACSWMSYQCLRIRHKSAAMKLIWTISLSDLIYSFSNLMAAVDLRINERFCQAEGFLRQFSAILSIFLATATALLSYKNSQLDIPFNQKKFFSQALWISVTSCLFLSLPPLFMQEVVYGRDNLFCWVKYIPIEGTPDAHVDDIKLLTIFIFEGFPLLFGLLASVIGYLKAIKNYKQFSEGFLISGLIDVYRLLWYPALLFIIFVPSLIDNIVQVYVSSPYWIEAIHLVFLHSIGLFNAIVYGVQTRIWTHSREDSYTEMRETVNEAEVSTFLSNELNAVCTENY